MDIEQLTGRYFRLWRELAQAYAQRPWHSVRIDRLAADIPAVEAEIAERTEARNEPQRGQVKV